jgi:hypothetical protein
MSKIYLLLLTGIMFAAVANGQINYFSKAAATDFTDVNSWGTNADGTGTSPASITNADNYTIQNASVMNLNAGSAAVRQLTINSGSLTVGSNTLTVSRATGNLSTLLVAGGTLTVTGGTIIINGNFLMSSGALNQSGGNISIDGNDNNTLATSVASATHLFSCTGGTPNCTAGTITIVDPPANTIAVQTTRAIHISLSASNTYFTGTHTFVLGDGVSTTPGNTDGFTIETYASSRAPIQNVTVNAGNVTGRWATTSFNNSTAWGTHIKGTLTINSGSEFTVNPNSTSANEWLVGSIVNNGTLTTSRTTGPPILNIGGHASLTGYTPASASSVTGSGVFRNLSASPTAHFGSLVINNANGVSFGTGTLTLGTYGGHVSGTLTMTSGAVNTNSQLFVLGISTAVTGTLTYTAGGFSSGSEFGRWYLASGSGTTIAASTIPTFGTGSYPFITGANSRNFHINRPLTTGATGGIISVVHTDGVGVNTIATVTDGAYNIDRQSAANWTVNTSGGFAAGTGTFSYAVSGQGTYTALNTNGRLMKAATFVGTHQAGTTLPHVQRTAIAAADYTGTFYLGIASAELPIQTAQSGPWEDINTWTGGVVPVCGNNAAIMSGHTVTVNAAAANTGTLVINAGGALTVSGNTLTVGCTNNNNSLTNSGTLTISAGTLAVNGNINNLSGSTFTQSGGDIVVNGNSGTVGTSVLTGTPLVWFQSNLLTLSGGKLTIVTGHIGTATADRVITYTPSGTPYPLITTAHTVQFGDGVTTTANSTKGFELTTGTRFYFGNVIMNSVASANAFFASNTATCIINGDLTITNGDFRGGTTTQYIGGNIVNNGTLTNTGTLYFGQVTQANMASPTPTAATAAQSVSGTGVFRNLTASPTANFTSININNTSATGVTFSNANSLLSGANTGTASGTLTLTNGYVNTGSNAFVLGISAASTGTLAYTAGGFASGSTFSRWWGTATGGATITAGSTPTGTAAGVYPFAIGTAPSFTARNLYLNQTVAATTGGKINVTYNEVAGTSAAAIVDGAYTVDVRSNGSWVVSQTGITGTPTYTMALNAQNLYNAANGNSRVTLAAAPATGTHQNGSTYPNAQRLAVPLASLGDTYYIGINNVDVPFISVANGAWETPATWNKNAVPTAADAVIIANTTTVTVNAAASAALSVVVNSGGTLTVSGSTLTIANTLANSGTVNSTGGALVVTGATATGVTNAATTGVFTINGGTVTVGPSGGSNRTFSNSGTLTLTSGTLNVNGNLLNASGSTFAQSAGDINIDGNDGTAPGSVAITSDLFAFGTSGTNYSTGTVTVTGGNLTIVDPHFAGTATSSGGAAIAFRGASGAGRSFGTAHTTTFGGVSGTNAGTATLEFFVDCYVNSSELIFGNVVVNGGSATRRLQTNGVSGGGGLNIGGNLTINSGSELLDLTTAAQGVLVSGNVTNNGTFTQTNTTGLRLGTLTGTSNTTFSATTNAQTISGGGTFRNLSASPTASLNSLNINNTNASGVTLSVPLSVSGTLTFTAGIVNTTTTNLLSLGTATVAGTLSGGSATAYINGPFARTFAASRTASGTYTVATLYPVGKGASYLPIHVDPTTTAGGAVVVRGETFTSNSGTAGVGVNTLSTNRWEALVTSGGANLTNSFVRLNDAAIVSTNKILQSSSAAGSYSGIPAASTFAAGSPNTLTSATAIPAVSYTGYFAYGDLTACTVPADQPTAFATSLLGSTSFTGSFTAAASTPSNYLVVRYLSPATETLPSDFTTYAPGGSLGAGTIVSISGATTFNETGLTAGTAYSYYIYSYNNSACAGPVYRTASPLIGNVTTCAAATGVPGTPTVGTNNPTNIVINWTASSTPSVTYELDVATDNAFTSFVSGYNALNVGAVLTYDINTNILPATTYYIRLRAKDGSNCYSVNSGTLTVTTLCNPIASFPWSDGFESLSSFGAGIVPSCWSTQLVTGTNFTSANTPVRNSLGARTGTNYMWSRWSSDAWLYSPGFTLTGGTSYDFSYYYRQTDAVAGFTVTTAYGSSAASGSMTNVIGTITDPVNTSYVQVKYTFTPASTGTYYFGVHSVSPNSDPWYLEYDDFTLDLTPACPVPSSVSVSSLTATTASVSFTSGGSNFIVEYGAPGFTPGTGAAAGAGGTVVTGTASPIALSGLTGSTSYDVYVRQVCTGPSYSANTSVVTFTTACSAATIPYLEDFESITAPAVPSCFRVEDLNSNTTWVGFNGTSSTASSGTKSIRYNYSSSIGADDWFFVRAVTLTGGTSYRLKFKYKASDGPLFVEQMEVMYGTARSAASMTLGTLFSNNNINNALADPFLEGIADFTPASTGEYYIGFHCKSAADQAYLYVDDISVDITPACAPPITVAVGSITATTASVSFTSGGTSFIVEYGAPGFTPGTGATAGAGGTVVTGSASPIALSGLTAAATYDVYVRQVCAGPSYSANSTLISFTTECNAATIPYTENFDGVTAPALPPCTKKEDLNGGTTWITATSSPRSGANALTYEYNSFIGGNDWFYTAPLSLTGGTSYRLTFWYSVGSSSFPEGLEVKYGTANNAAAMTSSALFSNTNLTNTTYASATVDFTPASTGTYYIGFHNISAADQFDLYVDDINVDLTPACAPPTGVSVLATSATSASVSFTASGSDFIVEYGPVGFTPGTDASAGAGGTVVTGNAGSPISITGIALADTTLDVYVRKICAGPTYSVNSTVAKFLRNDDAAGALTLTVGSACTGATFTNANATKSTSEVYPSCSGTAITPVWFKFVAPASGAVRISTDAGTGNTFTDSKIGLFSATDPTNYGTFSIISCDDDGGSVLGSGFMSVLYATGLTAGNTYYVAVDKYSSGTTNGTFCITVDELAGSMLAASSSCTSTDFQTPSANSNTTYTGWVPLLDQFSNLVALVRNPAGGTVSDYSVRQTISGIDRTDATSGQQYLRRNYAINNSGSVSNVDVQFFFLNSELTALQAADPAVTLANMGVTRQTGTTCQADFVTANGTNSYIPQTGNGTTTDGLAKWVSITTPGFSNFYLHTSKAQESVKVFLQGAYSTGLGRHQDVTANWSAALNTQLTQPYNTTAFGNYAGTESVASFPAPSVATTDVTDWILLELRDAVTPSIIVKTRAAFVREDGQLVDLDGVSPVAFRGVASGNYFLNVRHRNHLPARSALVQIVDGALGTTPATFDYTTGQSQAYQNSLITTNAAMKDLSPTVFGLWGGNANSNNTVRASGVNATLNDFLYLVNTVLGGNNAVILGPPIYSNADLNMNGVARASGVNATLNDFLFLVNTVLGGNNALIFTGHQ